jgi:hypothetical protein
MACSSSRLWGWADSIPGIGFTHRPLPEGKHDLLFHLVDVLLQVCVVLFVLRLATFVDKHPGSDYQRCDGNRYGKVYPKLHRNDRVGIWAWILATAIDNGEP